MPGKTARALCPVCQEPMPPDETECENCGAFVIDEAVVRLCRALGIPREKALALFEKGFRSPKQLQDRNVDDVLQSGENGLLFLCTNCGGFVATRDPKCPRCGAEFEPSAEEPEPEKDILDLVLCPVCGADNEATWKECEICGEPLAGTEEPPGGEPADETPSPLAPAADASAEVSAPATPPQDDSSDLDDIDAILRAIDRAEPESPERRVRPIAKLAKIAKPAKPSKPASPTAHPVPRASPRAAHRQPGTPAPPRTRPGQGATTAKPPAQPALRAAPKPRPPLASVATPPRKTPPMRALGPPRFRRPVVTIPSDLTGGLLVAAAATLYLSYVLGQTAVGWGVAFAVTIVAASIVAVTPLGRGAVLQREEGLALIAGAVLGTLAPVQSQILAFPLSAASAVSLAFSTRHLLRTRMRDLVAAASGVPLVAIGVVVGLGLPYAGSAAWGFGLLALVPWPAAVALEGVRQRRSSAIRDREITRAETHLERQQYAESVRDFDRAIALGGRGTPGEEMPWYGKGASLVLLGRYEEALRAIDKALDLNPRNEVAWLNKGNALTKMGRPIDALRCFNAAIKVNPKYEVAWNNKGNTLARLGKYEDALACYERALELDPGYRGAWVNKGYVLTKMGRYDEATSCADRALRLDERPHTGAA